MDGDVGLGVVEGFLVGRLVEFGLHYLSLPIDVIKIRPQLHLYISQLLGPLLLQLLIQRLYLRLVFKVFQIDLIIANNFIQFVPNHHIVYVLCFVDGNCLGHGVADFQHLVEVGE